MTVSFISHGAAVLAFATFAGLLLVAENRRGPALLLALASLATCAWSGAAALDAWAGRPPGFAERLLETLRSLTWIGFLYQLLLTLARTRVFARPAIVHLVAALYFAAMLGVNIAEARGTATAEMLRLGILGRLAAPIVGLLLIENLARLDWPKVQWWARFLFVGLGGIFAFDLFLYSEALLFERINPDLYAVRGAVDALAVPLMAFSCARNPKLAVDIHVSRQFVFHTMTLAGSGMYLLLMATAGYYLREFGGSWGTFLQIVFLVAALALVFLTLSSGVFRSAVRNFIARNFFSNKYDYRLEWLRFIGIISTQETLLPLHDRIVQAIAGIADSPAASLWVHREEDEAFVNTAALNAPLARGLCKLPPPLFEWLENGDRILDPEEPEGAVPPPWVLALPNLWAVIPLIHRTRLRGLLALSRPRAQRQLLAEDVELLRTVGHQAASYIAEEEAGRALITARQFEIFNQRFAFVVHDVKNLVSQLSLVLSNADRHGDNPDFQKDVIATVRHSVTRMKELLEQISQARRGTAAPAPFDLAQVIRRDWQERARREPRLALVLPATCHAVGEPETIAQVLQHLVQNAFDAIGDDGRVELRLVEEAGSAVVTVADNGCGMTCEFIRDQLFQPFDSSKKSGYGIGAYQARELVRRMGGRLEVTSTPGAGTDIRIQLPLAAGLAGPMPQVQNA